MTRGPQKSGGGEVLEGVFSLFAMTHTMTYDGPEGPEETRPWDGSPAPGGPFTYASRPCSAQAPINNLSTDLPALGGAVPGSRVPVSTRTHPMSFEVDQHDGATRMTGSIALTVCHLRSGSTDEADGVADRTRDRIDLTWTSQVDIRSDELLSWAGTFTIVGGTGVYQELRGEGDIAGYFFCFDPGGCASLGTFRDCQYAMIGRYRIPASAVPAGRQENES